MRLCVRLRGDACALAGCSNDELVVPTKGVIPGGPLPIKAAKHEHRKCIRSVRSHPVNGAHALEHGFGPLSARSLPRSILPAPVPLRPLRRTLQRPPFPLSALR